MSQQPCQPLPHRPVPLRLSPLARFGHTLVKVPSSDSPLATTRAADSRSSTSLRTARSEAHGRSATDEGDSVSGADLVTSPVATAASLTLGGLAGWTRPEVSPSGLAERLHARGGSIQHGNSYLFSHTNDISGTILVACGTTTRQARVWDPPSAGACQGPLRTKASIAAHQQ